MELSTEVFSVRHSDTTFLLPETRDECTALMVSLLGDLYALEEESRPADVQAREASVYGAEQRLTQLVGLRERRLTTSASYVGDYVDAFGRRLLLNADDAGHGRHFVLVNLDAIVGMMDDLVTLGAEFGAARLALTVTRCLRARLVQTDMDTAEANDEKRPNLCHCDVATFDDGPELLVSSCQSALMNVIDTYVGHDEGEDSGRGQEGIQEGKANRVREAGWSTQTLPFPITFFCCSVFFLPVLLYGFVLGLSSCFAYLLCAPFAQLASNMFCVSQEAEVWCGSLLHPVGLRHFVMPPV